MSPDEARALLSEWRDGREDCEAHQEELGEIIQKCLDAEISKTEIAEIAGLSRTTVHRYVKEFVA